MDHLKNILRGFSGLFEGFANPREYSRLNVSHDGFQQDAKNLRTDCHAIADDLHNATQKTNDLNIYIKP